jgi:hypothetical protein
MTDQAQNRKRLVGMGDSFEVALDNVLSAALDVISAPASREETDHAVRFQASAGTQTGLVGACLNAVMQEIDAFDRRPRAVILDGVRPVADGYRSWGTIFLDTGAFASPERVRATSIAVVQETGTGIEISIEVILD